MSLIETLRTPKIGPFAVFDFVTAFAGMYYLGPKVLGISRRQALWATVPTGIAVHALLGIDTPLNRMVLGPGHTYAKLAAGAVAYKALTTR